MFRAGQRFSGLGSGLMARQPSPAPDEAVAALKVCPHCGAEYETGARFCPNDGASLRPKSGADPLVGRVLAERYHVLKMVAEGGMGRVYLAEHVRMNRQCAIKVMRQALVEDPDSAARFAREASNAARIIHPNVAAVFDYGEAEGLVFLVMEYVDGEPLGEIIQRERALDPRRALDITRQVCEALIAAHELGIIHRDLKPDNILVTRMKSGREVAKVVDFGIAKAIADAPGRRLTETGLVIGTPEFMAPEQLIGDPADARSDIYALGCITYLMLTGIPVSDAPTREGMLKRRLHEPAPHARVDNPAVPHELDQVVAKMLTPSPADRWQSASELKAALDAIPVATLPTGSVSAEVVAGAAGTAAGRPTPRSAATITFGTPDRPSVPARRVRRRWPAVVGGGVVLAAAAIALYARSSRVAPAPAPRVAAPPADSAKPRPAASLPRASDSGASRSTVRTPVPAAAAAPAPKKTAPERPASGPAERASRSGAAIDPAGIRAPIEALARALESLDITRVQAAWPGLTQAQRNMWEKNVFSLAEAVRATVQYTGASQRNDRAEVDFTLRVRFRYRSGETGALRPQRLHAVLSRRGAAWQIDQLTER